MIPGYRLHADGESGHNRCGVKIMDKKQPKKVSRKNFSEPAEKVYTSDFSFKSDPFGSYTGHPKESREKPEQDADDL